MRTTILVPAFLACMAIFSGRASAQAPDLLSGLERLPDYESRRSSSADPNWRDGNGDCRPIEPGKTLTLAELEGPGRIVHIWFTIAADDPHYPRTMTLRIYWDGDQDPAVESPIGDFFAVGHGLDVPVSSLPVQVSSDGRARNCYWPMPFRKSARITVSNDSPDKRVGCIYWYIDWQKLPSLPEDTMYFHAQYRQEFPCRSGEDYLILDAEGEGAYVGTVLSVHADEDSWFGEGDDRFYIDGEEEPSLRGTGTEDYFCDAWGFRQFTHPFYGVSVWEGYDTDNRGTAYRWHIADPVRFKKSLKVTIEHKGVLFHPDGRVKTGFGERADNFSSVAFWYQKGKAKRFATLPPGPERVVRYQSVEAESLLSKAKAHPKAPEIQALRGASGGSHLFFTPPDRNAWIEIPFEVPEDGRYALKVDVTRSWDYGIYQISLDGKPIGGPRNFHSSSIAVREERLGTPSLTKGAHVLRFECTGSVPESKVRETGQQGHYLGIDRIRFRKLAIERN